MNPRKCCIVSGLRFGGKGAFAYDVRYLFGALVLGFTLFGQNPAPPPQHADVPVSLGLIIDNSGSMRSKRSSVEAAVLSLVKASNPANEVLVANFNDKVYFDSPHGKTFMTDRDEVQEALTRIDARGGSAIRDAVDQSIDRMKTAHNAKRVLIVVTDGVDNASYMSLEDLVRRAQQSAVVIYAIGLLADEVKTDAREARRQLNALAEATGGEAFYPKKMQELDAIAHLVASHIRRL